MRAYPTKEDAEVKAMAVCGAAFALSACAVWHVPVSWALAWKLPLFYLSGVAAAAALYWLFLALASCMIPGGKEYDQPSRFYDALLNSGYRFLYKAARVRIHMTGREKLPADGRFVLVSNHLSNFDNMIQSACLRPTRLAFISKPENFQIPIGGRMIRRCCYLPINRNDARSSALTLKRASELLKSGAVDAIGVYPEGHRGHGYELQPMHAACMNVAGWANVPIVVTTIAGTEKIHRNFPFRRTEVCFDILGTIDARGRRTDEVTSEAASLMQENLNAYRRHALIGKGSKRI